jgi:hypothetical protein
MSKKGLALAVSSAYVINSRVLASSAGLAACPARIANSGRSSYAVARFLSRRDLTKVAWHEVPGMVAQADSSRRDGVIGWLIRNRDKSSPEASVRIFKTLEPFRIVGVGFDHTVPYGTDRFWDPIPRHFVPGLRRAQSSRYYHAVPPGLIRMLFKRDHAEGR